MTLEDSREAVRLVRQALELDPSYATAASLAGWCCVYQRAQGWGPHSDAEVSENVRLAKEAIEKGKDDPEALWMAGWTIAGVAGEHAAAAEVIDRALALNPNSAHAWMAKGWVQCFLSRADVAIEALQRAMRLSPLDPLGYLVKLALARAHLLADGYEEAMAWVDRSLSEQPRFHPSIRAKVGLCGHLGRIEEGREWVRRLLELNPGMTVGGYKAYAAPFSSGELSQRYIKGFRKAGLPED